MGDLRPSTLVGYYRAWVQNNLNFSTLFWVRRVRLGFAVLFSGRLELDCDQPSELTRSAFALISQLNYCSA